MTRRRQQGEEPPGTPRGAKLGIVLVVCREQLYWLRELDCSDKHIYIYSKCGRLKQIILKNAGGGKLEKVRKAEGEN